MIRPVRAILMAGGAALALSACQSLRAPKPKPAEPPPKPPPVLILPKPPPRYPDTDGALRAAPGAADRYQLMAAGRILRQQRLEELERVVAGCREPR
jgi:hypothetical protein